MSVTDSQMTREVVREISKRPVDSSHLEVHVMHGVAYLRGRLERLRGYHEDTDLEKEHRAIVRLIRLKPGIIDVCSEVDYGGPTVKQRLREESKQHMQQQEQRHLHH